MTKHKKIRHFVRSKHGLSSEKSGLKAQGSENMTITTSNLNQP